MLFLEGRMEVTREGKIDTVLFVPSGKEVTELIPISIKLPDMGNISFTTANQVMNVSYNKVNQSSVRPSMRYIRTRNFTTIGSVKENEKDNIIPCTIVLGYEFINDPNSIRPHKYDIKLLIDVTDTNIRIHWRKTYFSNDGEETIGSTDQSVLSMSYNNDKLIQFILVDPSDIDNMSVPYISMRETEVGDYFHKFSPTIDNHNYLEISKTILSQKDSSWIYNSGEYAKQTISYSTKTEILPIEPVILIGG